MKHERCMICREDRLKRWVCAVNPGDNAEHSSPRRASLTESGYSEPFGWWGYHWTPPEPRSLLWLIDRGSLDVRVAAYLSLAIEARAALSPDALTGMEANLRFAGPETMETKIFGRLTAWQNWIFQRPNAVGERGALTMYGRPERPEFDWRRT